VNPSRVLLDTHVALWALTDDPRLTPRVRSMLTGPSVVERFLSIASAYEIGVKVSIGKLVLRRPIVELFAAFATTLGLAPLPVTHAHCAALAELPLHHRDPFDRLILAQAQVERLVLVTADGDFGAYGLPIFW